MPRPIRTLGAGVARLVHPDLAAAGQRNRCRASPAGVHRLGANDALGGQAGDGCIEIVDRTFDAFGKGGAGALAAWMILSGNRDALDPILAAIRSLVDQLSVAHEDHKVPESTLSLVLAALGDSLLGEPIAEALGLPREASRDIAAEGLRSRIAAMHSRD